MRGNLFSGAGYLWQGVGLLSKPGVRRYVLIPLLINILLFSVLIFYAYQQFDQWITALLNWLPGWLGFIDWLLWLIFAVLILLLVVFTFSFLANFIAAPFNAFLAGAVETYLTGSTSELPQRSLISEVLAGLSRELVKLGYYLPRALLLLLLSITPVLNMAAPLLWFLFGAWMMAIQYLDYPMDNHQIDFKQMRLQLRARRLTPLGYGAGVLLATMVPLVNLIVMPAAVAGATACWLEEFRDKA